MKIIKKSLGLCVLFGVSTLSTLSTLSTPLTAQDSPQQPTGATNGDVGYVPNRGADMRGYFNDGARVLNPRLTDVRAPRGFTRPAVERVELSNPRERLRVEAPGFSPQRTYTIPGDPQVRVVQPAPVYTRPAPVERIIYRQPVYEVRSEPEVIVKREVEYVPVPDRFVPLPRRNLDDRRIFDRVEYEPMPERYVEVPRRNLDGRRIFDEPPLVTRAPVRRSEPRVFVPQYEPLPEPPRFFRERDRGVDTRIGTSLPAPVMYDDRAFSDLLPRPTRYDFSRTPLEPEPVRYIRERAAMPDTRASNFASQSTNFSARSTLPAPARVFTGADMYREPQSSSMFRLNDQPRSNFTSGVTTERRSRSFENEMMREREMRMPQREMRMPQREMQMPQLQRDSRNTFTPSGNTGLLYY